MASTIPDFVVCSPELKCFFIRYVGGGSVVAFLRPLRAVGLRRLGKRGLDELWRKLSACAELSSREMTVLEECSISVDASDETTGRIRTVRDEQTAAMVASGSNVPEGLPVSAVYDLQGLVAQALGPIDSINPAADYNGGGDA